MVKASREASRARGEEGGGSSHVSKRSIQGSMPICFDSVSLEEQERSVRAAKVIDATEPQVSNGTGPGKVTHFSFFA